MKKKKDVVSPYYTVAQAAIILQKCQESVRRMCLHGMLPGAQKIGARWYILKSTIDPR